VAELIDGPTLGELLSSTRGRLLPEVAVLIAAQVAEALAAAHDRGVIHRDIKPDNVMVEKTGTGSRVVITDFGVAHVTGMESMTATGALVGSPAYMSPEQARGQDAGPPADVWAAGVLIYQMVTGALPFPGREPFAVIAAISKGQFRKPSQLQATVSPELDRIVLQCMSLDPGRRPTVQALARELRALAEPEGGGALRRFLDDPEAFEAELRPRVADAAVARARQHIGRGELGRALAQIGRATAYVPEHRGAAAALRSISARRRWSRVAGVLLGLGALTAAGYAISVSRARVRRPPTVVVAPAAEAPRAAPIERAPSIVRTPPPVAHSRKPVRKAPAPVAVEAAAVTALADPLPPPPPAVAPPRPGRVKIRAPRSFCLPSLDDRPPVYSPAVYDAVSPGKHQVRCALELGGPRLLVGEIDVGDGQMVERQVVEGPDGKPLRLQ
jgi:hypothetical protein